VGVTVIDFLNPFNYFFQTIHAYGGIDILVTNAATNPTAGSVLDVSFCLSLISINCYIK